MRILGVMTTIALLVSVFMMSLAAPSVADEEPVLVVGVYGGVYEDIQRKVFFEPFTGQTGIKIIGVPIPSLGKIKAMVEAGKVEVDLLEMDGKDLLILSRRGLLEKIDYSLIPQEALSGLVKEAVHPYGIGMFVWPTGITYNTRKYGDGNHPRTWTEFWDVKNFPGARALPNASWLVGPMEMALMADGVAPDKLYPLDIERAFRSLDQIRPHVVKWWKGSAEGAQILADGHADLVALPIGRTLAMKARGAPVGAEYNQSLAKLDYWLVPKGAKHVKNAMRLIAFYHDPKRLGEYAHEYPVLGPINRKSFQFIDPKVAAQLATAPEHAAKLVYVNEEWWAQEDKDGKSNFERVLERWNQWIVGK